MFLLNTLQERASGTYPMARVKKDNERENRIVDEIIVDAYGAEEQAMGWYYYLVPIRGLLKGTGMFPIFHDPIFLTSRHPKESSRKRKKDKYAKKVVDSGVHDHTDDPVDNDSGFCRGVAPGFQATQRAESLCPSRLVFRRLLHCP